MDAIQASIDDCWFEECEVLCSVDEQDLSRFDSQPGGSFVRLVVNKYIEERKQLLSAWLALPRPAPSDAMSEGFAKLEKIVGTQAKIDKLTRRIDYYVEAATASYGLQSGPAVPVGAGLSSHIRVSVGNSPSSSRAGGPVTAACTNPVEGSGGPLVCCEACNGESDKTHEE